MAGYRELWKQDAKLQRILREMLDLQRALEIATQTHIEVFPETAFRTPQDWIEYAQEKLESEAGE